jgi:hypothetical protein
MRFTKKQVEEATKKSRKRYVVTRRLSFLVGLVLGVSSGLGGNYVYLNWDECRDYLNERIEEFNRPKVTVRQAPIFRTEIPVVILPGTVPVAPTSDEE